MGEPVLRIAGTEHHRQDSDDSPLLNTRTSLMRNQALIGLIVFAAAIWLAWESGQKILAGDTRSLELAALGLGACGVAIVILR
ncbi:MAG TPA: hypothetical protein VMV59_12570, partial [Candidatus Dormibacteraeota bacterium]|nr:hypothetical protein [Candidatus Dormibacteraeota bacterium]